MQVCFLSHFNYHNHFKHFLFTFFFVLHVFKVIWLDAICIVYYREFLIHTFASLTYSRYSAYVRFCLLIQQPLIQRSKLQ